MNYVIIVDSAFSLQEICKLYLWFNDYQIAIIISNKLEMAKTD